MERAFGIERTGLPDGLTLIARASVYTQLLTTDGSNATCRIRRGTHTQFDHVGGLSKPFVSVTSLQQDMGPVKPLVAYLLLLVDVGKEHMVAKELRKLPGVTEAQVVYGEFDVVARVEPSDISLMDETVTMARKLPGVTRTSTLISSPIQFLG
jgi:DNA-binding Lrp family transcriptional regulator